MYFGHFQQGKEEFCVCWGIYFSLTPHLLLIDFSFRPNLNLKKKLNKLLLRIFPDFVKDFEIK